MKKEGNQKGHQQPEPDNGREFAARRTIVKGMASAVPVVMTIGCGQAMAQASSLRCIAPNPGNITECIEGADDYVRVPDDDGQCPVTPSSSGVGSSNAFNSSAPGKGLQGGRLFPGGSLEAEPVVKNRLLYVDQNGTPTNSTSGDPVTWSCYASFMPT